MVLAAATLVQPLSQLAASGAASGQDMAAAFDSMGPASSQTAAATVSLISMWMMSKCVQHTHLGLQICWTLA